MQYIVNKTNEISLGSVIGSGFQNFISFDTLFYLRANICLIIYLLTRINLSLIYKLLLNYYRFPQVDVFHSENLGRGDHCILSKHQQLEINKTVIY